MKGFTVSAATTSIASSKVVCPVVLVSSGPHDHSVRTGARPVDGERTVHRVDAHGTRADGGTLRFEQSEAERPDAGLAANRKLDPCPPPATRRAGGGCRAR